MLLSTLSVPFSQRLVSAFAHISRTNTSELVVTLAVVHVDGVGVAELLFPVLADWPLRFIVRA